MYTDACTTQLGSVITQLNRPLAFFSRKLSEMQWKYSVTEKELLAIVETLKEFKGMLWGQKLIVYTDHQNLMRDALGVCCNSFLEVFFAIWQFLRFQICSRSVPDLGFADFFPEFWSVGRPTELFPDRSEINFQVFVTPIGIDSYVQRSEFGFVCHRRCHSQAQYSILP